MRCSRCGSDNREGRKFCAGCGAPLTIPCPKCTAPNEPGERFCGECGTALAQVTAGGDVPSTPMAWSSAGERRQLTVLFCDLVGSTEIAAQLDPEEWRETVAAYHRAVAEAITRYEGYVAKYLGDGAMALFGYLEAHDNDGGRAARAGLAALEAVLALNHESSPKLVARAGIDTGAVVVGAGANENADVFGETPNIAARLQATAVPGTVLMISSDASPDIGRLCVRIDRATHPQGSCESTRGLPSGTPDGGAWQASSSASTCRTSGGVNEQTQIR
jgi:class 3 adenylate cyclase